MKVLSFSAEEIRNNAKQYRELPEGQRCARETEASSSYMMDFLKRADFDFNQPIYMIKNIMEEIVPGMKEERQTCGCEQCRQEFYSITYLQFDPNEIINPSALGGNQGGVVTDHGALPKISNDAVIPRKTE